MKQSPLTDKFAHAVLLAVAGDPGTASALSAIAEVGSPQRSTSYSRPREAAVLIRDRYTCRYCGFRMISTPVLRAMADLYPEQFKYHKNWKASESDVAFWRDCTSVDHVLPRTRHGGDGAENLVTSCWPCNLSKGNLTLEELGWEKLPIAEMKWDGLSSQLRGLVARMPSPPTPYYRSWLQAIEKPEPIVLIS